MGHRVDIPPHVAAAYSKILVREGLLEQLEFYSDGRRHFDTTELGTFVGNLRRALAEGCIQLLTPDLIILDEFQRFTEIMHGQGEDAELARMLLRAAHYEGAAPVSNAVQDADQRQRRGEPLRGLEKTNSFLLGAGQEHHVDGLRAALSEMRQGILSHRDPRRLTEAKTAAESLLLSVMVRTERLAVAREHDGMLDTSTKAVCPVTEADVDAFIATDRITQDLERVPSIVEYWKSALGSEHESASHEPPRSAMSRTRKRVWGRLHRGFKSHRHRQPWAASVQVSGLGRCRCTAQ